MVVCFVVEECMAECCVLLLCRFLVVVVVVVALMGPAAGGSATLRPTPTKGIGPGNLPYCTWQLVRYLSMVGAGVGGGLAGYGASAVHLL